MWFECLAIPQSYIKIMILTEIPIHCYLGLSEPMLRKYLTCFKQIFWWKFLSYKYKWNTTGMTSYKCHIWQMILHMLYYIIRYTKYKASLSFTKNPFIYLELWSWNATLNWCCCSLVIVYYNFLYSRIVSDKKHAYHCS